MGKFLGWTCLVLGVLIVAVSVLLVCRLVAADQWSAAYFMLAFHVIKSALGVALIVFGYRKLKWIRAEEAYYKAIGGRPDGDDQEPDLDELYPDD